ncbi:transporter substrate-binding domain-containing protein [Clostridium cellulovorans]|uniref:Extracellular solute-binding protein family 3 n=1 Tax=Clostridium cellulovorans (strain ATCC 35296 / DSM 3052 / OCM 3 / 743B) TaxID=573061 RepID=D9SWX5_CLOC7|nr:transporter substrate-binding domain-containing protein [Clostridium cellulovorans]ADL51336.1 extracellular solute-binding protein family 3 [Clostridium cellulovorans 743B]
MKKKLLLLATAVFCVAGIATGCKSKETTNVLDKVKEAKVLKVGLESGFAPLEYKDENDKLVGFDVDLANAIGDKLGVKVEFVDTAFDTITQSLKKNDFDIIIAGLNITEERKKEIDFTEPYIMSGQSIIVQSSNKEITSEEGLKGKKVGVGKGTTSLEFAEGMSGLGEIVEYEDVPSELMDLKIGRIDAVIVDEVVGDFYVAKDKTAYKKVVALGKEPMGIAVDKGQTELLDAVQKAYNDLKTDGTLGEISNKWFGMDIYK